MQLPFAEFPNDTAVILEVMMEGRPKRPKKYPGREMSESLWSLVERCWAQRPAERPAMAEVLRTLRRNTQKVQPMPDRRPAVWGRNVKDDGIVASIRKADERKELDRISRRKCRMSWSKWMWRKRRSGGGRTRVSWPLS